MGSGHMGDMFGELLDGMRSQAREETEEKLDRSHEAIFEALERETLNDLKFGDVLKQKLLGEDYRYTGGEKERPVFVRYIVPVVAQHYENGNRVDEPDIIVASGVFKPDGMLVQYAVDSRHYEKA